MPEYVRLIRDSSRKGPNHIRGAGGLPALPEGTEGLPALSGGAAGFPALSGVAAELPAWVITMQS